MAVRTATKKKVDFVCFVVSVTNAANSNHEVARTDTEKSLANRLTRSRGVHVHVRIRG
jgi:hypothetical protein